MKQIILTMFFVVLAGVVAQAQSVPPLVNYQGTLTDADGKPLTGTKKLEFNLYDAATEGNKVWGPQLFNSVPLVNGMFNVILGTTDTEGRSIAEAFGGKDRYLGIKVDDGEELAPRQQILSAPFAINAENAKNADVAGIVEGEYLSVDPDNGIVNVSGRLDFPDFLGWKWNEACRNICNKKTTASIDITGPGILLFVQAFNSSAAGDILTITIDGTLFREYKGYESNSQDTSNWNWVDDTVDNNSGAIFLMPFKKFAESLKIEFYNSTSTHESSVRVNYLTPQ